MTTPSADLQQLPSTDIQWLASEMAAGSYGDARLSRRVGLMTEKIARAPELSLPKLLDPAELEAAYRFLANRAVTPAKILEPHVKATLGRMHAAGGCLLVHDTTTVSYRVDGKRKGLGRLKSAGQGFFAHVSLAMTDDGTRTPLGVLDISTIVRDDKTDKSERLRWGEQVERIGQLCADIESPIHLMDREADDYALFCLLKKGGHRFVIRLMHNRLLVVDEPGAPRKLDEALARVTATITREVPLSSRPAGLRSPKQLKAHPARRARLATLAIGATTITLQRPTTQPETLPASLALNVVRVWEINPPEGQEPVEWILVTSEPVETEQDLVRAVDRYRARWVIEEFFKALKTGCAYERRQLEDFEGLFNAFAFFAPIAWHLLLLRSAAQREPQAPALRVISPTQLEVLRALGRLKLSSAPTCREVMLAIAALGGHLKFNGDPGWLTLARGYHELLTLTRGWTAAKLQPACDQS
jgi:Transposase DNA-binding/Transposase DDE domain